MIDRKEFFSTIKRAVIKVGTNLLVDQNGLCIEKVERIVHEIISLKNLIKDVVVVSSGSIGAGRTQIFSKDKQLTIPQKQASASIGQVILMKNYMDLFDKHGFIPSQLLLTNSGLRERSRYVHAKDTLEALLQYESVIPIVNENDTVAVDEIKFGDNDRLAAYVTSLIDAELLILLSDVDGFYLNFENRNKRTLLHEINEITPEIVNEAKAKGSNFSTGGMQTKIKSACITTAQGIPTLIANGTKKDIIKSIFEGNLEGTLFLTDQKGESNKKRWILLNSEVKGSIHIDENAAIALVHRNKSLLPKGITQVMGRFNEFDTIDIYNPFGKIIAKGITFYGLEEINKIKGLHSSRIESILGYHYDDVVIHKDNLVLIK